MIWNINKSTYEVLKSFKDTCTLYFEFAPSGYIHSGTLRHLIKMIDFREILEKNKIPVKTIIGIQDCNTFKNKHLGKTINSDKQLKDIQISSERDMSFSEFYTTDFINCCHRMGIEFDELFYTSSIYSNKKLLNSISSVIDEKSKDILINLGIQRGNKHNLYYPKCQNCDRIIRTDYSIKNLSDSFSYTCENCAYSGQDIIFENGGVFPFKIEEAIKFKILDLNIQFAGVDHLDGLNSAMKINELLFETNKSTVHFFISNMVLNQNGEVIHKSLANGKPISSLTQKELNYIILRYKNSNSKSIIKLF